MLWALAGAACRAAEALPDRTIPQSLGFNVHLTGPEQEWGKIKDAGVKLARKDFAWDGIERVKGQYDFAAYVRWTCTGGFDKDHWPTFHEFRLSAAGNE